MPPECVYCGCCVGPRQKREHVIPRLLGAFERSWTLDCVCDACNAYFGEHLEIHLGRDSTEAIHRLERGIKKASESGDLPYTRVTLTIEQDGPFCGARAIIGPDGGDGVQPIPLPQIGFRRPEHTRFRWVLEADLTDKTVAPYRGGGWQMNVIGPTEEDRERVIAKVEELGIPFTRRSSEDLQIQNEHGEVTVLTEATLDIPPQRAIAKIAFNFATYVLGPECVRDSSFNAARRFIRSGSAPGFQIVTPSNTPILADDGGDYRQTPGHLIVIGWERRSIVVRFSPFNLVTYRIILVPLFIGLWREIAAGFLFDYEHHKIVPLTSARLIKPVAAWPRS